MSDLSVIKNDIVADLGSVAKFFESFTSPSTQAQASSVASQLQAAAASAETLLPSLANDAANAALALIPNGLGTEFAPFVDSLIDQVIAKLTAKKSTSAPAS